MVKFITFCSLVLLAKKKTTLFAYVDYRALNKMNVKNHFLYLEFIVF